MKNLTSLVIVSAVAACALVAELTSATDASGIQAPPTQAPPTQAKPAPVQAKPLAPKEDNVNASAKVMADFVARVDDYAKLRDKVAASAPRLPQEATPQQIDQHPRALLALMVAARRQARQGDIFFPQMQTVVHALMAQVFKNPADRAELRASIAEDNTGAVKLTVNGRYPDTVPMATMPPDVLKNLPPLPKEMEYRFVGESLILLDVMSHLIVDFMSFALPKG